MAKSKVSLYVLSLVLLGSHAVASDVTEAVAISASQNAIAVTSGVVMKNMGMEPEYISTPNGLVAVPKSQSNQSQDQPVNPYKQQNDQAGKKAFFDGDF
ncbi:hypothetical protein L3V79_05550 [Thiotrichales bacterium 19S9-12]|nr:hypothetical protein [Thiotrichales bacterium 19S9-11]MCF6811824.1 hypothetical protein [Thiotrichales bacterium 19S9-12]